MSSEPAARSAAPASPGAAPPHLDAQDIMNALADPLHTADAEAEDAPWDYDKFDVGDVAVLDVKLAPHHVLLRDKVSFTLGVLFTWTLSYWLGWRPQTLYQLYTLEVLLLGAVRWVVYRLRLWHLYMLDICYFVNLLLLAHIWIAPRSRIAFHACFGLTTGPLLFAIPAFRNSLVFHSLDRVTSVYMHLVPALVTWTLRWHPRGARFGPPPETPAAGRDAWEAASSTGLVLAPMVLHACWAVAYYLKVFVVSREKIQRTGRITLFTYILSLRTGVLASIARRVPLDWRPIAYLTLHAVFCAVTSAFAMLCYRLFWLHTGLLCVMGTCSVYNGACFYFQVFARKCVVAYQPAQEEDRARKR